MRDAVMYDLCHVRGTQKHSFMRDAVMHEVCRLFVYAVMYELCHVRAPGYYLTLKAFIYASCMYLCMLCHVGAPGSYDTLEAFIFLCMSSV